MKLSDQSLIELNLDELFKAHTVAEIQNVHKDIQVEIEKKREELRTTVGERYRDLLKAADTITDMKDTARTVVTNANNITSLCQVLQEKHLLGFTQCKDEAPVSPPDIDHISRVLEVRILLSIPEQIWTAIDNKQFSWASEIYLLACCIHLNLQVSKAMSMFPIVPMQWKTIATCRGSILESSYSQLRIGNLSHQESSDALISVLLLEGTSIEELLKKYLELRSLSLQDILTSDDNPTVKDKLHAAVLLVQSSLTVVCLCFMCGGEEKGSIEKRLCELTSQSSPTTLSKMPTVSALIEDHLTALVKQFRPSTIRPVLSLPKEVIRSNLQAWLQMVRSLITAEMPNLLGLINNLRGVLSIRERVSGVSTPPKWNEVEEVLDGPYQVFSSLVEPHVTERTLQLVAAVWKQTLQSLKGELSTIDNEIAKDGGGTQSESDLRWYIWKDSDREEVSLKTRGLTPRVLGLCKTLDTSLAALLEDVNVYLAAAEDKLSLLEYLNTTSFDSMNKFATSLKEGASSKSQPEACIILRARLLQGVLAQCPNLKKCLRQSDAKNGISRTWSDMSADLLDASTVIWRTWKEYITPKLEALIKNKLDTDVTVTSILLSRPACEVISITEETEDNTAVTSELRVPSQPSFTLQELLLKVCLRMNAVALHTLPRIIHQELIQRTAFLILDHYEVLCNNETLYQSHAWQLLLDIRFISTLFLSREQQSQSLKLCTRLEGLIDPFDLNVCYPYLQANVKKSALRLQGTFGVLVDYSEKLAVLNSLKVSPGPQSQNQPEDPNVAAMSNGTPWFSLLPISSGTNRKKEESPSKHAKQRDKENKKESVSSDFVRSAGAFFGAMTGGWS